VQRRSARRHPSAALTPSQGEDALPHSDPERLGPLLAELEPRLTAVALRFTRDPDVARDVVQNAFEKVVRHGSKFRGQALVSTWVHRIVANEALMWLRSERRRARHHTDSGQVNTDSVVDPRPGPAEQLCLRQRERRLLDGLARLAREEQEVVRCCALAGQTYAEYGARTGTHPAAVKSRAFRARRRLGGFLLES
jgi:RNA polymerase sigma-70 factor (ECF subfamily)